MADREPVAWVTVNGKHVPIYEGESKQDAVNRSIADTNSAIRERQIAENKKQSDKLNQSGGGQNPPRRLFLKDISAEDANKTTDVLNLNTKQRYKFKDGTKITGVHVFAGKGCSKEFRNAEKYANRYGGKKEDWQHCAGTAQITNGSKVLTREVHWVQGKDGKMREAFIKFHRRN